MFSPPKTYDAVLEMTPAQVDARAAFVYPLRRFSAGREAAAHGAPARLK